VEAADADRQTGRKEGAREVDSAGKLVGLNANQRDQRLATAPFDVADDPVRPHPPVRLVIGREADFHVGPKDVALPRVFREPVQAGERVRRDRGADPLDRVTVVVVVRRLDQDEMEQAVGRACRMKHPHWLTLQHSPSPNGRTDPKHLRSSHEHRSVTDVLLCKNGKLALSSPRPGLLPLIL
jgi:hypothetical protein